MVCSAHLLAVTVEGAEGSLLTLGQCLSTPGPQCWPILQSFLVPLWWPMLVLPGWWEVDIERGPGQCDVAHKNGVRELSGGKELGRSDPRNQKLAPSSESSALERTLVNFCHSDWQVFGSSFPGNRRICPKQNWKSWHLIARKCPGGQKSLSELTEGSDSWLFQVLLLGVTHTKRECTERPQY